MLNQSRTNINSLLARISALSCGFFLLLLGVFFIASWVNESIRISMRIVAPHPNDGVGVFVGYIAASATLLAVVLYFGVAFSRFILRALPPQPSGTLRLTAILLTIPSTVLCVLLSAGLLASSPHATWAQQAGLSSMTVAIYSLAFLTWWGGVIFPLFWSASKAAQLSQPPVRVFSETFLNLLRSSST